VTVQPGTDDDQITDWALRAARGDRAAAAALVSATQRHVYRFLTHLAGPGEAEDLTQETFLRALRSLPSFAGRSTARTWLLAIARRVAADHVRAALARPRIAVTPSWEQAAETAAVRRGGDLEDGVVLRGLLDGLAPERREAFVATQILGLSYVEAAQVCGCPVGTIRSRVARAREDLIHAMQTPGEGRPRLRTVS
jgi:RNA polymerase sigma-70 factor (ECF subfamily)